MRQAVASGLAPTPTGRRATQDRQEWMVTLSFYQQQQTTQPKGASRAPTFRPRYHVSEQ